MPHQRPRFLLSLLEKRLKLFPIVGILGARQTGKSTLLRELLTEKRKTKYVTLDRAEIKEKAIQSPSLFVRSLESSDLRTLCIDEIQKAPSLFDTLKAEVDEKKRPGRFAVSGSTEFSKKTGIHDSLTGRISLLRMFPFTLGEILGQKQAKQSFMTRLLGKTHHDPVDHLREIQLWADRGGMPGIFSVRDEESRTTLFDEWIETTCSRDLAQFHIPRFDADLARRILQSVARASVPQLSEIAKMVGKDSRKIKPYIEAFKAIFVVYEVSPHVSSVGKSRFYLFDSGVAKTLGSDEKRRLQILFINECLAQSMYSGQRRPDLFYYESAKGSAIDFIVETRDSISAYLLSHDESPGAYTLRAADSFQKKNSKIPVFVLAPCLSKFKVSDTIHVLPWSVLV